LKYLIDTVDPIHCLMLFFPRVMACALVVVLDFDGSFRPPRDPGVPTIPSKIAACSASISISIDGTLKNTDDSSRLLPVAVGCHWLPLDHETTSAHAEYFGMLAGLEFLNSVSSLSELLPRDNIISSDETRCALLIRGDCKAVIDQLLGRSTPRKVESLYNTAENLLAQLETKFDHVEARHIPREDNALCDSLCSNLMNVIEWKELTSVANDLERLRAKNYRLDSEEIVSETSSNGEEDAQDILRADYLFSRYLKSEARCRIRYSWRPALYEATASFATETTDFDTLVEIGERQEAESAMCKDKVMLAQGIRNQMRGWTGQGKDKKASYLARKHRVFLSTAGGQDQDDSDYFRHSQDLFPAKYPIDWHGSIHHDWHHLLERFDTNAMAKTWKEGSRLWIH
jgi:ribonuclease HI